jgi:DMSO reductase family type II enzyme heme b subunit
MATRLAWRVVGLAGSAALAALVCLASGTWAADEPAKATQELKNSKEINATTGVVTAKLIHDAPPEDPLSPLWDQAPEVEFLTSPQVHWDPRIFNVTVKAIKVRALQNGKQIAIRLEYADPIENPGDAVAVEFPVGDKHAHFAHAQKMAQVDSGEVNIWYKKASDDRPTDMNAHGFKTLKAQDQDQQNITGKSIWKDGVWRVTMVRPLDDSGADDVQFKPGKFIQIAFAAWDEANREHGAQKAVTSWWWFFVEPPPNRMIFVYVGVVIVGVVIVEAAIVRRIRRKR